ncbi:MAG: DUF1501 domain-containing protein [Planctomycetota bacterium]|nr:DUF1501 domain-containing protein [Planctomycetota bacterium]
MPRSNSDSVSAPCGSIDQRGCSGFRKLRRRDALVVGSLGALGVSLSDLFRLRATGDEPQSTPYTSQAARGQLPERIKSIIQLNLGGGFPQHESFDPKPEAPLEYRGSFGVTKTNTGEIFSDNLTKTASVADKLTVLRTVVGKVPDHGIATYHLSTGYSPTAVIDYPSMGSLVSHELGPRGNLPPYIAIPKRNAFSGNTGFLPSSYGVFEIGDDPAKGKAFKVRDFSLPEGLSLDRFRRRNAARELIEKRIRALETEPSTLDTMDGFYAKAYSILTSAETQRAFTFEGETDETFALYGSDVTGKVKAPDNKYHPKGLAERLIIARRLVEAGTRFVTIDYGAWDCHVDVKKCCDDFMAPLDHAICGLVTDLDRRGLLDSTLFWVTSEFGRTPKINKDSGRDHHARCYSMMLAGGGFRPGMIHGTSDSVANEPARDGLPLEDLLYTIYHGLGIDADKELVAFGTRPIEIIKDGKLVSAILS